MKRIFFLILLWSTHIVLYPQSYIGAILIPQKEKIPIFQHVGRHLSGYIINETEIDAIPLISIKKIKCTYAYIIAQKSITDSSTIQGWIQLKYLGINPANYQKIYLRVRPNTSSPIVNIIEKPQWGDLYRLKKKRRGWVYIETTLSTGEKVNGWMAPKDQASNPYTTDC